jgi:DNA-binding SARP family transcriptional activator
MASGAPDLTCGVLGPLEVRVDGVPAGVGSARQQTVLAILLLEVGQVVPLERLIAALWEESPPPTARVQVQVAISKLRDRLRGLGVDAAIATHEAGYRIDLPAEAVDLVRFRRLVARGREAVRRQNLAAGASALREALGL